MTAEKREVMAFGGEEIHRIEQMDLSTTDEINKS